MINVPVEFIPSWLLTCESVSHHSQTLLKQSRCAVVEQDWAEAERYALNARDASQRPGQIVDHVIALIHLADIYRGVGRLGPALEYNEKAQQMLKNQSGPTHYHNRAVADYALGLIHHVLGNDSKALYWYEHAQALFERAHLHWGISGDPGRQEQCNRVIQWISALSESINGQAAALPDGQRFNLAWLPVFHTQKPDQENQYGLARFLITCSAVKTDEIRMGDQIYTLLQPNGQPLPPNQGLDFRVPHFVVEIKKNGRGEKGALQGDLALVRATSPGAAPAEGTRVGQSECGDFFRDTSGRINFVGKKPHIIGGGGVVAVLQPKL